MKKKAARAKKIADALDKLRLIEELRLADAQMMLDEKNADERRLIGVLADGIFENSEISRCVVRRLDAASKEVLAAAKHADVCAEACKAILLRHGHADRMATALQIEVQRLEAQAVLNETIECAAPGSGASAGQGLKDRL